MSGVCVTTDDGRPTISAAPCSGFHNDVGSRLRAAVIASAMLGYVLSYRSIYLFHIVALVWIYASTFLLLRGKRIVILEPTLLLPLIFLSGYLLLSGLWVVDVTVWARYLIYWLCGLTALLAVYQSAFNDISLNKVAKLIFALWLLNMATGLGESVGLWRLPMSPYSPHVNTFGYTGVDLESLPARSKELLAGMPTGFNWNQNNFSFVALLGMPFVLLWKNRKFAAVGSFLGAYLLITIGSKGAFLAAIFMILLLPAYLEHPPKRTIVAVISLLLVGAVGFQLVLQSGFNVHGVSRISSAIDQVIRGVSLIAEDQDFTKDSTGTRAQIYSFGLQQLLASKGMGLGFGGAESSLIHANFAIQSFHFFFLQMLVDLGIIVFCLFFFAYLWLAIKLRFIATISPKPTIRFLAKSCSLALIVAIPASISPSGVHYVLPYYILIGLGLAVIKVHSIDEIRK